MLKKRTLHRFTAKDDETILRIVKEHNGDINESIQPILGEIGDLHSKRSILDRYKMFLSQKRSDWTEEEDKIILEACQNFKGRWSIIAKFFENRSGDQVKIRFHQILRAQHKKRKVRKPKQINKNISEETNNQISENDAKNIWELISKSFENEFATLFEYFDNI